MFTVSAEFRDKIEVKASFDKVRGFLFDLQNFARLMPNVESIRAGKPGAARWTISLDIPVVGKVRQSFPVELEETPDDEIEWRPASGEKENLLRYFAILIEKDAQTTIVQISQKVEIRRNRAKDLHPLAAAAGENLIGKEMNKRVAEMIKVFLQKAQNELET